MTVKSRFLVESRYDEGCCLIPSTLVVLLCLSVAEQDQEVTENVDEIHEEVETVSENTKTIPFNERLIIIS